MNSQNKSSSYRRKRLLRRKRSRLIGQLPYFLIGLTIIGVLGGAAFKLGQHIALAIENAGTEQPGGKGDTTPDSEEDPSSGPDENGTDGGAEGLPAEAETDASLDTLLKDAGRLAAGYDYDAAIELLKSSGLAASADGAAGDPSVDAAIAEYESVKATLLEYPITEITHVFFHSLVMDEAKAFDGDGDASGYNQVMTTRDEFLKILNSMYEKGFVLVRLHDIATMENGQMTRGKILLPPGKKAFVMSEDDVCYYEYMEDDGFARRMVIGDDGKPACEMVLDDGTVSVGSYDLVPILEDFIQEHPDFSYRGARAVIAFTGYQGIMGYRTAASYKDTNPNYEADCQAASAVAQCLRDNGWELASHSWGHRDLGQISYDKFKTDCDKWEAEVESLIGPTDIILYPFGADVCDWHAYTHDNERFMYMKSLGFNYFCNVDSNEHWVQLGDDYLRQGRRNLDGYRMWMDIAAGEGSSSRKLDDLFRAEDVFSSNRPTPVVWE